MIKIIVNGAYGKMGSLAAVAVGEADGLKLVAKAGRQDDLSVLINQYQPDVVIDFTDADSVYDNALKIIQSGVRAVIGSTGLLPLQIDYLAKLCEKERLGTIVAPNFSIGAMLLMRFAEEAAKYFPQAEIIELHHDKKREAPSGTAIKTAELIGAIRSNAILESKELIKGARGGLCQSIPIHSVRLPGLLAHQEVMFGDEGQVLTLRHDTFSRESFMPGVIACCHKVMTLNRLVYGLEQVL